MKAQWGSFAWTLLLAAPAFLAGCGSQVQVGSDDGRELIVSLATAVSAQNPNWLDGNARKLDQLHDAHKLGDAEYQTLAGIVATARKGDWDSARKSVYALREGQKPNTQDFDNLSKRKLESHHGMKPPTGPLR